ncbi:MAG: cobaltochelatase subunit CobN [Reyranella sp.]|uniref:cobaltochelatase subunit CobN n=1 Tax=Reyranella sp. TaxID=1929291 RepID=UPI001214970E|nr:cobaltochelatase subunit CobN [Reyranella sp.]TAJ91915.1 MAG: cobaltochelatase subunit CobN [Reyranella sp.]
MHVLATQLAGLDEADQAVDLGHSPADVVVLSFSDSDLSALAVAWPLDADRLPGLRLASLKRLRHPLSIDLYVDTVACKARAVILRCLGGLDYWRYGVERLADIARDKGILFAALPGDGRPDPRLASASTMPPDSLALLDGFFQAGGADNMRQALRHVATLLGLPTPWTPPVTVPSLTLTAEPRGDRPRALVVYYRANLVAADTAPIDALVAALEVQGLAPMAVAVTSLKDPAVEAPLAALIERHRPSIILNTTAFSALRKDDTTILDRADVPVLQVVLSGSDETSWRDSPRGLSPSDMAMNVVLPELDGRLLTRAISFKQEQQADARLEHASVRHAPLPDRVDYVARLAANWVRLATTPRPDRRVALVLSDYPARGGRAGYAVGLDTVQSTLEILGFLREAGFDTGPDVCRESDIVALLKGSRPYLRCGKIVVLLQPDRGSGYHDIGATPADGYVETYRWLRDDEKIDALIHLGTHGTLEWLPGKSLALSAACWPERVLGPVPVAYPFIVNNPGEAMQAKRRLSAVTIGHLNPPLSSAGLHGALAEMEGIIEEYAAADGLDRRRLQYLEAEIVDRAWSSGLAEECGLTKGEAHREAIAKLDARLCDIKNLFVREQLHVFGRVTDLQYEACARGERAGLLAALDGRRVAPGPAGAPSRGRPDVLPTGRNLSSIDPRAIPTRTALAIGKRAADEVVRRYLQDHGEYPRALVIDLWASASLRTGGDDLAQAFSYLGVRPVWSGDSGRVTGIEILPPAVLGRPRIDVTLRISGLFRDIFESQIALFDLAVRRVAALDEDASDNPLAEAARKGEDLARVFGGAPGSYGAQAGDLALDGTWQTRSDLGEAYLAGASHAYGGADAGRAAPETFRRLVSGADALVHPQDDRERDVLDGDGVADFAGGFAAAAAHLGNDPELYHLDTSQPDTPAVRRLSEEVARIVRGRLTNPRWISGMLTHGHNGVGEIAQAVDALFAFAATAQVVPASLFDATYAALIADEAVFTAMQSANPAGADAIVERLRDAQARGLWVTRRNSLSVL